MVLNINGYLLAFYILEGECYMRPYQAAPGVRYLRASMTHGDWASPRRDQVSIGSLGTRRITPNQIWRNNAQGVSAPPR